MAFDIRLARAAKTDIASIMEYTMSRSPSNARKWLLGLFDAIDSLREMPIRHALIAEASRLKRPLRGIMYYSHRVIYEVDENNHVVVIIRIYHASREPLGKHQIL